MSTLQELYEAGTALLAQSGIGEARLDAWLLLEYRLSVSRAAYWSDPQRPVSDEDAAALLSLYHRRAERIPLQYLTGEAYFYGRRFLVNENVLIPRQDTEILTEQALKKLEGAEAPCILDLCTGSGCILVSVLLEKKNSRGLGIDISEKALDTAKKNAELNGAGNASFLQLDLMDEAAGKILAGRAASMGGYHLVVSNPPYIETGQIDGLMDEVRLHEPKLALDGGGDGLSFYRRISLLAPSLLREGGWLLTEIGCSQADEVRALYEKAGLVRTEVVKDLGGLDRVVCGRKP